MPHSISIIGLIYFLNKYVQTFEVGLPRKSIPHLLGFKVSLTTQSASKIYAKSCHNKKGKKGLLS